MDYAVDYAVRKLNDLAKLKNEIQTSGIKRVSEEWYTILMNKIQELNQKIMAYQENGGSILKPEIVNLSAEIEVLFKFYMQTQGAVKLANLNILEVTKNLGKIIDKLNRNNYKEIEEELEQALALYNRILKAAVNAVSVNELLARFKYQVFKYKMEDYIIDDSININDFIVFVLEDIEMVLRDDEASPYIKDELRRYAIDTPLIMDNFYFVMFLIILGLNKSKLAKEDILKVYSQTFYKESDIEKMYQEPSLEIKKSVGSVPSDLEKIFKYFKENAKEMVPEAIIYHAKRNEVVDYNVIVDNFIKYGFQDVRYLADALLANGYFDVFQTLRKIFKSYDESFLYAFDCAVIAYRDTLKSMDLVDYIICSDNSFLIDYVCKSGRKEFFTGNLLDYACNKNNEFLLNCFINNDEYFDWEYFIVLPSSKQIAYLERKLNEDEMTDKEAQELLVVSIERGYMATIEYAFSKILIYNDFDLIIKCLNKLLVKFESKDYFLGFINSIPSESLKQEVLDYYYKSSKENASDCSLIRESLLEDKRNGYNTFQPNYFFNFNVFEVFFASSFIDASCLLNFVKAFYKNRLDWEHILKQAESLSKEEFYQIKKYCYLGDRDYFINKAECSREPGFIRMMIREVPESIVDFLANMGDEEVSKLPSEILEIFCRSYEEKMDVAKETVRDKLVQFMNSNKGSERIEFLTYIMHRGLLNTEIMAYIKSNLCYKWGDSVDYGMYHNIMFRAIKNTQSYLRPSLILQALDGHKPNIAFNWECLFMSSLELIAIDNNDNDSLETKDLKKRKYYGDLLKLLALVPDNVKQKIIFEISRCGIEEYLLYIKTNYPEYMDLVLANVTDPEIYKKLIDFNGDFSIDEALRFRVLVDDFGKPRL